MRRYANVFHGWRRHGGKSLANRLTSDPKVVIHSNVFIILFLTRNLMSWTHSSAKINYRSLILPLFPRTVFSYLALWRHYSWSVTSLEHGVLALWRHIHRLFRHVQIDKKAIFTSEWRPWISISHHPVFTGLRVRKSHLTSKNVPYGYCNFNAGRHYLLSSNSVFTTQSSCWLLM